VGCVAVVDDGMALTLTPRGDGKANGGNDDDDDTDEGVEIADSEGDDWCTVANVCKLVAEGNNGSGGNGPPNDIRPARTARGTGPLRDDDGVDAVDDGPPILEPSPLP
jgi:hypothetical protein